MSTPARNARGIGWSLRPASAVVVLLVATACGAPVCRAQGETSPLTDVTGATRVEYDEGTQQWTFRGAPVILVRDTLRVQAPEVLYNIRERRVTLPQRGTVSTPTIEVTADRIDAVLSARHVTAEGHVTGRFLVEETWATFAAGQAVADDRPDARQIVATGEVAVMRGDQELRGDRAAYDLLTQRGTVDGHVELARGNDRLRADHVDADLGRREAEAEGHVVLERGDLQGSADHAAYAARAETAVLSGHVVLRRGADTLTAERVTVRLDRHTAIAEGHPQVVASPQAPAP